ncbi:heavy metal-responsive transcriptional regulator [cf. Phormidesmis sp. LEGE 11477]|uniref:heavy metal-responsive transcriptional regulator n=1 Tax=cf. Phormidesmis sp. LEGE 11477 TaxID=1828680 RepID=UPI001880F895|nr:heavy metal-responsive transcriptional regulator [cf. Phormidesmis sp. LEGE 11477]MBE9061331.1 heavy metal-responsive transcriptional regulator [cf. Phormidesmis sp. LEGE 11477]
MNPKTRLKIGEISNQTGVAIGALRYYETLELLTSERGSNGYRYYSPAAVQQVLFIKKAQALGFSLEEIRKVLAVSESGQVPCGLVRSLLQEKIEKLAAQIRSMSQLKTELEQYQVQWIATQPSPQSDDICPLIDTVEIHS